MPLGTSWTRAEYRRYLMGLGVRPVPSVTDIGALLESYAAKKCGVHRGVERGGSTTYGTNAHRAREVLASGRPLRPPSKRRIPRRRPPSIHSSLRLASPKAIEATWEDDEDALLTGTAPHLMDAYKAGYAAVGDAPSSPTRPPWSPRGRAPDSPKRQQQVALDAPRRSPLKLEAASSKVLDETREEAKRARIEAARLQVEAARLQAELTARDSEKERLEKALKKHDKKAAKREAELQRLLTSSKDDETFHMDQSTKQYRMLEEELSEVRQKHDDVLREKEAYAAQSASHQARLAEAEAQLVDTSLRHAELAHSMDELRLQGRKQMSDRERDLQKQLENVRSELDHERKKPPQSPDSRAANALQKRVQKLERRLQKERAVAEHAAAVLEHAEKEPPHDDRLQALEASISKTLEALDGHEDEDSDELLEAEQHLADLEGLHEELVERSAKSPVKPSLSSSSDEAEPPAPRRATPLDAARASPRRLPSDDDDEEGWPAPPTASDDGGRGPAYSFDVDEPPPPPQAAKDAPAPIPSDSDDSSEGWPEPAATPAMPSKAPPRRLDTIRSDDGSSDDSGDAWPDAKPSSGGYGQDDTAEGVVGITAPTGGNDDDDSDSGDDWGAPSREASSSTAPVAQTSGEIHTIDDWDDEAPAPAPPRPSPLDAAVAARRAAIETDSDDSSEGWPSPTAGKAPAAADDMDDGSDDSDIESAVEQRKDSWPSDDESEDSAWGRK